MSTETPEKKKSYKDTLNLPQTAFAMEAKLVANEPTRLKKWQDARLYDAILAARTDAPTWTLHDGPPFANGDIHMGHVLNKTLKDVLIRYKTMAGFKAPYVPGWDCHGLPIEHKIQQDLGKAFREMSAVDVRQKCAEYAQKYVDIQCDQFQRLGILGDWSNPYLTMRPQYEAAVLEVFAKVVENGLVYKQLRTGPWSIANQTALADAELEYKDVEDNSIYVAFPSANPGAFKSKFDVRENAAVSYLIWTTTPWTLPANLAIAAGPEVEYALVRYTLGGHVHVSVVASALVERVVAKNPAATNVETIKTVVGSELAGLEYSHPFIERVSPVLTADYVTTTDGTGLVHTAPGHGEEDYDTGIKHGLPVYCPVLPNGRYDSTTPAWLTGLTVWEGNGKVIEKLTETGHLFAQEKITHSYAHDWRSKTPIIYRATEQWFIALDKRYVVPDEQGVGHGLTLRDRAVRHAGGDWTKIDETPVGDAADRKRERVRATEAETRRQFEAAGSPYIDFVPAWGQHRLLGMLQSRPDWCISRQRSWGLPIPVFYNEANEPLLTPASVRAVAKQFAQHGSDAWFKLSAEELLEGCDCGPGFDKTKLRKEKDIFDVWFESGSSWHAVVQAREQLSFPADLYLEGSDQHRGWFQLSLLPALAATGVPPFKQVLTHGFIVGPDGKKVSKSDKNYVTALTEINRHGADVLRLYVASNDYEGDIATSPKSIAEFGDKYRKIRNTFRYLLSNLYDYDGSTPAIPASSLDAWALDQLDTVIRDATAAYESYELHKVFRLVHEFCAVQISSVYGNAMKDRLYCEKPDAPLRRRCQSVMHRMLVALTKLVAPVLVFTADEAWEQIPHKHADDAGLPSVHLARLPIAGAPATQAQRDEWATVMTLRADGLSQLDVLKKSAGLNKAGDAEAVYAVADPALRTALESYGVDLEDLLGTGFHSFAASADATGVTLVDRRNDYAACARSWKRRPDVGADAAYPDLSARDAAAVAGR